MSFIPAVAPFLAEASASAAALPAAVAAAGTGTVLGSAAAIGASYSAGASARYYTLRHQDKNADLVGPDDRPILVDEPLMNSLQGELYVFTHKAIWGCWILLPTGLHTARDVVNTVVELPPTEHWAFVARAECRALSPPRVAYFIAQFGNGDFIKPLDELEENDAPFRALLQETRKDHAALCVVQGPSNPDVWIHAPNLSPKRYVYRNQQLVSPGFREEEWVPMSRPLKLRELNDRIFQTRCTGREYHALENNCQRFSVDMFNDL
ncbi:hypothetical protein ACHWQZ_G004374 [Mnemiopsis leidyi]